jgi:hypothetical protein
LIQFYSKVNNVLLPIHLYGTDMREASPGDLPNNMPATRQLLYGAQTTGRDGLQCIRACCSRAAAARYCTLENFVITPP